MIPVAVCRNSNPYFANAVTRLWKTSPTLDIAVLSRDEHIKLSGSDAKPEGTRVGLTQLIQGENQRVLLEDLLLLWSAGCRRFVLHAPFQQEDALLQDLPHTIRDRLAGLTTICTAGDAGQLEQTITEAADRGVASLSEARFEEFLFSWKLYNELLRSFSHNRQNDLANRFLAPARLLLRNGFEPTNDLITSWNVIWAAFTGQVLEKLDSGFSSVGEELRVHAEKISKWLDGQTDKINAVFHVESMMSFLTECRELAGERTVAPNDSSLSDFTTAHDESRGQTGTARVLVVDDHADEWRPVFDQLKRRLADSLPVDFHFSKDAKTETDKTTPLVYGHYDLVILDIFIGSVDGRDILRDVIRRDYAHLPVLLWTTSRDDEITSKATLASGILLKKSVTWHDLETSVRFWLREGRMKRQTSLPNRFFDHAIRHPAYRELALQLNEWCLKQLDSFHALDGSYFRFFTDHGGRHILKLMELLEQALLPFLGDPDEILLAKREEERHFELFTLYLAVICHELGMFPLRVGGSVEDFSRLGNDYLDDVRTLHAVRGMVLIQDREARFWNDIEPRSEWDEKSHPGRRMHHECFMVDGIRLADALAAIVGYHARFMKSLKAADFLRFNKDEAGRKISRLRSTNAALNRSGEVFASALERIDSAFNRKQERKERLRKQCALFRFVDAVDVTRSRNPALYLLHSPQRGELQNREYLKHQVCSDIRFCDGTLHIDILAEKPDADFIKCIVETSIEASREDAYLKGLAQALISNTDRLQQVISDPWQSPGANGWDAVNLRNSVVVIQKFVDEWLTAMWRVIMGKPYSQRFLEHLQDDRIGIMSKDSAVPQVVPEARMRIASITALSKAGEILDEYEAIIDAGLTEHVRLGDFWQKAISGWSGNVPESLTILREGLRQYTAGLNCR